MQVEKLEADLKHVSDRIASLQALDEDVKAATQQTAGSADQKTVLELQDRLNAVDKKLEGMQAVARGNLFTRSVG